MTLIKVGISVFVKIIYVKIIYLTCRHLNKALRYYCRTVDN